MVESVMDSYQDSQAKLGGGFNNTDENADISTIAGALPSTRAKRTQGSESALERETLGAFLLFFLFIPRKL